MVFVFLPSDGHRGTASHKISTSACFAASWALLAALQKNPVNGVQSTPPHRHTPSVFSVAPEPSAQGVCTWLQVLVAAGAAQPTL